MSVSQAAQQRTGLPNIGHCMLSKNWVVPVSQAAQQRTGLPNIGHCMLSKK